MNTQVETQGARLDGLKWAIVALLVAVGVVGNTYFTGQYLWGRIAVLVVLAVAAGGLALRTAQGLAFLDLLKETRVEGRKIVWPSKEETWQTTLIVLAVVVVMSLVLWGLDSLFGWIISSIIG